MKNLHLIATDKPSRLAGSEYITNVQGTDKRVYKFKIWDKFISNKDLKDVGYIPQNIYITNDEVIKVGDWACHTCITNDKYQIIRCNIPNNVSIQEHWNKIILTTDQELIADGVQAIDEEFLEWFVKNPTCEEVEIEKGYRGYNLVNYKIIIPNVPLVKEPRQVVGHSVQVETLEEAAEKLFPDSNIQKRIFIKGAKWQQDRMYSEKDMIDFSEWVSLNFPNQHNYLRNLQKRSQGIDVPVEKFQGYRTTKELFEQFKKQ